MVCDKSFPIRQSNNWKEVCVAMYEHAFFFVVCVFTLSRQFLNSLLSCGQHFWNLCEIKIAACGSGKWRRGREEGRMNSQWKWHFLKAHFLAGMIVGVSINASLAWRCNTYLFLLFFLNRILMSCVGNVLQGIFTRYIL